MGANKSFYILLIISLFFFLMMFGLLRKIAPLAVAHTIYYCQAMLSNIVFTLPHSFPSIFVLALSLVMLVGISLLIFQLLKTILFIRKVLKNKISTPKKISDLVTELGISDSLDVVKSKELSSFCHGYINPRICLSTALLKSLNIGELKAVLLHESYHLKHKDPLKILLSQVAVTMFFFVPILKDIHRHYTFSKEIAADQLAIQLEEVRNLRSALIKILVSPTPALSGVASFGSSTDLEQRVNALINNQKVGVKISLVRLSMSFTAFMLAVVMLNLPVYAIEDSHQTHSYFICPYGKDRTFTPANYSPSD